MPNPPSLILPPGHRVVITIDADSPIMGVNVVAYRGNDWLGSLDVNDIADVPSLQGAIDMLTGRGPRRAE